MNAPTPSALIVCHPGHELRVFGWMAGARPRVFVLTDGSGSRAKSRLTSTRRVLDAAGAEPGSVFGRWTDAVLYDRLRSHDHGFFIDVAEELADELTGLGSELVVADAAEGYNSGHDVCRLVVDAAVSIARRRSFRPIRSRSVALVGPPGEGEGTRVELSRDVWERKLDAARAYTELAGEVEEGIRRFGESAFAVETLVPVAEPFAVPGGVPFYEEYGARQVATGHYAELIRYGRHVAPLARTLSAHVERGNRCAA